MVMARIGRAVLWGLAALLAALLLAMVIVPRLCGWVPLTVLTGSMEPTIPPGSQVYVKPIDESTQISAGQVITFMPNPDDPTLVTHRVVGVSQDGSGTPSYVTQGDANNAADPEPVARKQVRGTLVYHLPFVGRLALAIGGKAKLGGIIALGVLALLYAAWQVIRLMVERRSARAPRGRPGSGAPSAEPRESAPSDALGRSAHTPAANRPARQGGGRES
ncbi:signal peptidase I [Brevibacterium sp. 5221]|uniref:Signal peptidase I n=2 Tax=Brevibacterium rongguiense TaxID=2695267 RepID=A0A6N9H6S9_9MICO|nr:signal peptidase I [Brevibacterium rongguiense]